LKSPFHSVFEICLSTGATKTEIPKAVKGSGEKIAFLSVGVDIFSNIFAPLTATVFSFKLHRA